MSYNNVKSAVNLFSPELLKYDRVLLDFGLRPDLVGFTYIEYAFMLMENEPGLLYETCRMYTEIAKGFPGANRYSVEHAIRHTAECCFDNLTPEDILELFGRSMPKDKGVPANSQFINSIYRYYLRMQKATIN